VEREPLVLFTPPNINWLEHFMPSKKSSNQLLPIKLKNNLSSNKLWFTWNLIILILSSFMAFFALTRPSTFLWNSANLEISTKKWDKLDLYPNQKSKILSDKYAALSTIYTAKISCTETLRQKTLFSMINLSKYVILDGPVKLNTPEKLIVELLLTFHLKLFKKNFTTKKLTFGAQVFWSLS
jgi:hypothetical protein